MKMEEWLSFKVIGVILSLIASSCALIVAGWVAAEWREQHAGEEARLKLLHQVGELANIINPSHAAALSFKEEDRGLPAYKRICGQFRAYNQELPVSSVYGLGIQNGKVVYGPSLFLGDQSRLLSGKVYPFSDRNLVDLLETGKRVFLRTPDQNSVIALAPVLDLKSNDVVMTVALEIPVDIWKKSLGDLRFLPFAIVLLLLTCQFLGVGAIYLRTSLMPQRLRHLETVLVALFSMMLIGAITSFIYGIESREHHMRFMRFAESETQGVESNLRSIQKEIIQIAQIVAESNALTSEMFTDFVESFLDDTVVESCYMLTALKAHEKESLEQRAAGEGFTDYRIYRLDDSGKKIPVSGNAGILYPIYYDAESSSGAVGPGFNLGSIAKEKVALENAARTGIVTASIPERKEMMSVSGNRVSLYAPIYDLDDSGNLMLRGFIAARIRLDLLLPTVLGSISGNSGYIALEMLQMVEKEVLLPLADTGDGVHVQQSTFSVLNDISGADFSLTHSMLIFSHTYVLAVRPTAEFLTAYPIYYTYSAFLIALIIAMVIIVFVALLRGQQGALEARVWKSTVDLRESGETFRRLFSESTDSILLLCQGKIVDCNNATLRLLKYASKKQILKHCPEDFSPPRQSDGRPSPYAFKEMVALCVRNGHHAFEWTHAKSDGTLVPVEIMSTLITIRGEKQIHVICRDITERKLAEEALRSSEENHRSLVDSLPIGLFRYTPAPDEQFVMANKAMAKIHGSASLEELMDISAADLYANPEDREQLWQDLINTGAVAGREMQLRHKDGSIFWGELSGIILRNSKGEIDFFDGSVMDITKRKQADEQRIEMERRLLHTQKLESLGVLAGGIAHDFNNLLAIVLGNLEFAAGEVHRETLAHEYVGKAVLAARRASALTDQMLAYSGKGRFIIKAMDLSVEVEENLQMLNASIPKDVVLNLDLQESLPPIYADEGQIQQVVMNLITNAAEAIGDTSGTISIKTEVVVCTEKDLDRSQIEEKPEPGEFIVLEIIDSGCGMDEETRNRVFDPFFTTKFTGRGLGMSAVLGILQGHKGAVELKTEVGKGTTIRLFFPVAEPPEDLPVAEVASASESENPIEPMQRNTWSGTILVVDDEAPLRELGEKVLSRFGFDTISAVDGQEAVEIFLQRSDDIVAVLLDLTMPRMDGVTAFEAMRKIKPDVKVILCSGFSEHEAIQRFSSRGLAGYVHKPYRITALRDEIEKVMKGKGNLA
ncbi:MAG: PAS domain S-box protein [Candidatus Hydrogenedentes bacterium]|nr:PAS domain S-box protein [Candidatus Hydrogenedentota bacterium]